MAEYDDRIWSIRYGIFAMPTVANGIDLDWAFSRAHGQNGEFELRHSWIAHQKGVSRVLFFANRAHMGTYREANDYAIANPHHPRHHPVRAFWRTEVWLSAITPSR